MKSGFYSKFQISSLTFLQMWKTIREFQHFTSISGPNFAVFRKYLQKVVLNIWWRTIFEKVTGKTLNVLPLKCHVNFGSLTTALMINIKYGIDIWDESHTLWIKIKTLFCRILHEVWDQNQIKKIDTWTKISKNYGHFFKHQLTM